jgi:hypothetical protein
MGIWASNTKNRRTERKLAKALGAWMSCAIEYNLWEKALVGPGALERLVSPLFRNHLGWNITLSM